MIILLRSTVTWTITNQKTAILLCLHLILQFPPRFAAGDVGSSELDLKLPNSVFNTLKQHSYREEKHSARLHEKKEHATHVRQIVFIVFHCKLLD